MGDRTGLGLPARPAALPQDLLAERTRLGVTRDPPAAERAQLGIPARRGGGPLRRGLTRAPPRRRTGTAWYPRPPRGRPASSWPSAAAGPRRRPPRRPPGSPPTSAPPTGRP